MNLDQIMHDLTYWFDYSMLMVLNHPFISVAAILGAFLFYQALSAINLIGTAITFALAALTALFLGWLMF